MTGPVVDLTGVERHYAVGGELVRALDGVSLEIDSGEIVSIMGSSGSGKSTLMNVLGCLDRPTGGEYRLNGHDVSTFTDDRLSHVRGREIGFIFQSFNLLPRLTAIQNVELPLRFSPNRIDRKVAAMAALERVDLADRAMHRPTELSGGQQQRVAIARALVNRPSMILADEPTGNLDSRSTEAIVQLLQDLNSSDGITILLVTHETDVADATRRIVTLRDGRVVDDRQLNQRLAASVRGDSDEEEPSI